MPGVRRPASVVGEVEKPGEKMGYCGNCGSVWNLLTQAAGGSISKHKQKEAPVTA